MSTRFRFVHEIVGTFVLAILALLIVGILYAGRIQGWFDEEKVFSLMVPAGANTGLREDAEVLIGGNPVGRVTAIHLTDNERVLADISIRGEHIDHMREGSRAVIKRKLGITGDAYIEITRGTGPYLKEGKWIQAEFDEDFTTLITTTVREVREAFQVVFFQVSRFLTEYTELAESLENPIAEADHLLFQLNRVTAGLEAGEGTAGQLLKDPALAEESVALVRDVRASLVTLEATLASLKAAAGDLPGITAEAPGVLRQVEDTLAEVETLIESLQKHWLIRKYVDDEKPVGVEPGIDPATLRLRETAP